MKLRLIVIFIAILFIAYPMTDFAQDSSEVLRILLLTDVHFCNLVGYEPVFVTAREHYGNSGDRLAEFLTTQPRKQEADAVVITGDLIDYFEAETEKGAWLDTQIEQFNSICYQSPLPVFMTLGNHDIASYWIEETAKQSFQIHAHKARAAWIRNISCFREGTYYARDYIVGATHYHLLFLDNGYSLGNGAYLDKTQLDWLNYQLKTAGDEPVVIFMHKYLSVADYNNDGVVFNARKSIPIDEHACARGFLKTLNDNKNIKAVFVGHGHRNVSEMIPFPAGHKILQMETSAFAADPNHWRRLDFFESKINISKCGEEKVEVELNIH